MMLQPTVADLTKGKINRYELAIATAKCARAITDEYLSQKEIADKAAAAGKDAEFVVTVDSVLADVKAVRVAIDRIHEGQYRIVRLSERTTEVVKIAQNLDAPAEAAEEVASEEE